MAIKEIEVELTGTSPLLMASPKSMLEPKDNLKSAMKEKQHDAVKEAEKLAYRTDKGKLYVPSTAIKGTLLASCSRKKLGKYAAKGVVAANVRIKEKEIILPQQKYEIFTTTAVLHNGGKDSRIVVSRPKIDEWNLNFTILYDNTEIGNDKDLKELFDDAGSRIGLLAWRPAKGGEFGCFKITKWKAK